jgi:hypothetical protein
MLGERVLVNGVGTARSVAEIDLQPLRRDPRQPVGDHILMRKEALRQLVEVGVVEQAAVLDRGDQPGRDSIPPPARAPSNATNEPDGFPAPRTLPSNSTAST